MAEPRRSGFTLIELMIVVAIIGILAMIAIPKFADLLRKSQEGKTKGNLGGLRSALSIYYADMEGTYPFDLESLTVGGKYLTAIPKVSAPSYHAESAAVRQNTGGTMPMGCGSMYMTDVGAWFYWNDDGSMCGMMSPPTGERARNMGEVWVGCQHTDTKGSRWTTY